ncbi:MAG TPA: MFS transporter [Amycolatopsis sp.]|jgi:MHS family alpha-ketoglutarate permease-like MFS transporter|nr:MFS transporter [Amycolatopsis sp.]
MSETTSTSGYSTTTKISRRRQVLSGVVGMMLEMYDWQVYGLVSIYIAGQVFAGGDSTTGLLNTLLIFGVGFFIRPIGGAIMGSYADRHGRKRALVFGMVLLGLGSLLIAIVPTYSMAGPGAPAILLAARLLQGFAIGGEQGASVPFLSEIAPPGKRALYNAFGYIASTVAIVFATVVAAGLPLVFGDAGAERWAWRIPFALGALFTVFAIYLRRNIEETELFTSHSSEAPKKFNPLKTLVTTHIRPTLLTVLLISGITFSYYTWVLQYATFAHLSVGLSLEKAQIFSTISLVIFGGLQPIFAKISDRVGRRRVLILSALAQLVITWPALLLLTNNAGLFVALQVVAMIPVAALMAVSNSAISEFFPTSVRGVGVAFPYAVSVALFGGTAPYLVALFSSGGRVVILGGYGSLLLVFTVIAAILMKDRHRATLS